MGDWRKDKLVWEMGQYGEKGNRIRYDGQKERRPEERENK